MRFSKEKKVLVTELLYELKKGSHWSSVLSAVIKARTQILLLLTSTWTKASGSRFCRSPRIFFSSFSSLLPPRSSACRLILMFCTSMVCTAFLVDRRICLAIALVGTCDCTVECICRFSGEFSFRFSRWCCHASSSSLWLHLNLSCLMGSVLFDTGDSAEKYRPLFWKPFKQQQTEVLGPSNIWRRSS